jgi:hypothetical protein
MLKPGGSTSLICSARERVSIFAVLLRTWAIELHNPQGRAEDCSLDYVEVDLVSVAGPHGLIYGAKCFRQLASDGGPFRGQEIVVLEDEEKRRRSKKGHILTENLGFAEFRTAQGRWLSRRMWCLRVY